MGSTPKNEMNASRLQKLLASSDLSEIFNELGWDNYSHQLQPISIDGETYVLSGVAEKRGVTVYKCSPNSAGNIPPRKTLLKIEREVTRIVHEHLLIFQNAPEVHKSLKLTWLWVQRVPNQPIVTRTHIWTQGDSCESLRQKLMSIVWSLDKEEAITLTDVITGLRHAFDKEKVTNHFYDRFNSIHQEFSNCIDGLVAPEDKVWYTSLMLNRLMFIYFIQRKGFLDGNINYLSDKLLEVQEKVGKESFHSFYRIFLRRLFHEGLGTPKDVRQKSFVTMLGDIPYLNGGLFEIHKLEKDNPEIDIKDEAFNNLFRFFNDYDWHLDDRPIAKRNEINPDVLGYIFEKYINQKEMGAYYTKEDITDYISKNTIIPNLLEQVYERCKVAFEGESIWNLLKESPERYLYSDMKKGVINAKGEMEPSLVNLNTLNNKGGGAKLPTETNREYIERRKQCLILRDKLANGEVTNINDLITFNIDVRQFIQDIIETCTSPYLLRAIWQSIVGIDPTRADEKFRHGITILDPTCGSGAFLFAALNVLEPLYEACLDRMDSFNEDADTLGKNREADFGNVLDEVNSHPSRHYFIYKSIILHNLYGVDIMHEAVEICKLRLFLKLVSQVEYQSELEPLPDLDFNIRVGNTLVGYATEDQFDKSIDFASNLDHQKRIKDRIGALADQFISFRKNQMPVGSKVSSKEKFDLQKKLNTLKQELDHFLSKSYGKDQSKETYENIDRKITILPFHWFAEFYGVMREGGFDVVIGNPPYVATKNFTDCQLVVKDYETAACTNIYAWCLERVSLVVNKKARTGMITPLNLAFGKDYNNLRELLYQQYSRNWFSHYGRYSSSLFFNVKIRNTIHIGSMSGSNSIQYTSRLHHWTTAGRPHLFSTLSYAAFNPDKWNGYIPKLNPQSLINAFERLMRSGVKNMASNMSKSSSGYDLKFKMTAGTWLAFSQKECPCFDLKGVSRSQPQIANLYFNNYYSRELAFLLLNGKLGFAFWIALSDDFHVIKGTFEKLPFDFKQIGTIDQERLMNIASSLEATIENVVEFRRNANLDVGNYNLSKCRHVTDKSDIKFARIFNIKWYDIELLYEQMVRN